ncbi:hypothetical protein [Kibdelosporangium aridum]|nr:hypothetical protein [Kibdelosporangium aridum]
MTGKLGRWDEIPPLTSGDVDPWDVADGVPGGGDRPMDEAGFW